MQALTDLFTGHRHASTTRRCMGEVPWSPEKVMRRVVRLVQEGAGFSRPSRGFLVIDDTILAHDMATTAMEQVAVVKDPATQQWGKGDAVVDETQGIDGRTETFASTCLTLTNHARVKVVAPQKADV